MKTLSLIPLALFLTFINTPLLANNGCTNLNKVPICHSGGGASTNRVNICVDFGALWGHIAQHPDDTVGECTIDLEEGLKVWACNAGLRHEDHNDTLCFDQNTGDEVSNCDGIENCLCSGNELSQVLNIFDTFSFAKAGYSQGNILSNFLSERKEAGRNSFSQASQSQGQEILNDELGVTFELGSERFGSDYFLDLCYEILNPALALLPMRVTVDMVLKADVFNGTAGYLSSAQVTQRSGIFCDDNLLGPYSYNNSPLYMTSHLPFDSGTRSFSTIITGKRSCFSRLRFTENQNSILRPTDKKQVTVEAKLDIEPVNPLPPQDDAIVFCNVRKVRGNQYTCSQQSFPDTASLRVYMTSQYNNIPDWNQAHNKDYRGLCRSDCRPLTGAEATP
ncbi:MAG: hypothetical protein NXH75_15210 [Halobacteriovoraceae bacterium]|nr:hypothetical protein [Halobacteriovoraceae bacterium]